jgi:glycosyl transferase family 25
MSAARDPNSEAGAGTAASEAFEALNGWADRIFVISMRRAAERRARMIERLAGLRFEFFDAVDKKDLDRAQLVRDGAYDERHVRRAYRLGHEMPLGLVGCSFSHRELYEQAVAKGWDRTVIFEDDVIPRTPDVAALGDALRELPPTWELCYLGYWQNEVVTTRARLKQISYMALAPLGLSRWRPGEVQRLLPRPYSAHLRRAGRHLCTHAYAVSREGARKLAAAQTPLAYAADQLLTMLVLGGKIEAYVTAPSLFDQETLQHGAGYTGLASETASD